jgi:hypothetical protein
MVRGSRVSLVRSFRPSRGPIIVLAALAAGAGSLIVARTLGYDAWAWMVWARELPHDDISTVGGPAFKALPVLVVAPLTPLGDVAPMLWLALMRACGLLALVLAARVGTRIAGPVAGVIAALLLAAGPDLYRTALYGSSEPLLLVLVLGAAECHLAGRTRWAWPLLALAGLIRPEAWAIVLGLLVLSAVRERRVDPVAVASAVIPPAIWLGFVWFASRNAGNPVAAASRSGLVGVETAGRSGEALALPALAFAAAALVVHRRRRGVLLIGGVAIAWVLVVAAMAQVGYPGSRRYLLASASLAAVLAGAGLVAAVEALPPRRAARVAAGVALAVLIGVVAFPTVRENARLVGVARAEDRQFAALRRAVDAAGGRDAVLAHGRPAVNPWLQTALAWTLHAPLRGVQATWHSSRRTPHWHPPAVVFRAPEHFAGSPPALPPRWPVRTIGRIAPWRVLETR